MTRVRLVRLSRVGALSLAVAAGAVTVATARVAAAGANPTVAVSADRLTAAVGSAVTWSLSIGNSGSLPATGLTVDDQLLGTAPYRVEDGTGGTVNSFVGSAMATVVRVATGHYRWTYPAVAPGQVETVRFSAQVLAPATPPPAGTSLTLIDSASTPNGQVASVTTTVPSTAASTGPSSPGGQAGGGAPGTGSGLPVSAAGFLLLTGIGVLLLGELVPGAGGRPRVRARLRNGPPPGRYR